SDLGIAYQVPQTNAKLFIFDVNGNTVFERSVQFGGMISNEWNALPAGRYVITLRAGGKFLQKIPAEKR
ncbi:MAG TPA: hypothetical protein PK366_02670, partial [Fibrobacteraceae bacterium]|nr:hypothetical protein [Fibrobacteraceae bacterium]